MRPRSWLACRVGRDDTVQMHDTIADCDLEADRPPVAFVDDANDTVANVIVVRRGIRKLMGRSSNRLQQIGMGHDTGHRTAAHHRQPLDVVLLHLANQFLERVSAVSAAEPLAGTAALSSRESSRSQPA